MKMNISVSRTYHYLELAVGRGGEPRTALSECCLQNLLSQTIVKLRE